MTQVGDPIAIVVSLTVYSEEPASTEDGQLFDIPLRESLPGRFLRLRRFQRTEPPGSSAPATRAP